MIPLEKDDINIECATNGDNEIVLSACFCNLPKEIKLDTTYSTKLEEEYLLNQNGYLEIVKRYSDASSKKKVFIKAKHPTNTNCSDLLSKKNTDLKKILEEKQIDCENKTVNSLMRKAIWNHYSDDLQLKEIELVS